MKILYIGDVMAEPGRRAVIQYLGDAKNRPGPDFVIAQVENADDAGKGAGPKEIRELQEAGVDFFTGGNHSLLGKESEKLFAEPNVPAIRPANLKTEIGSGWKVVETKHGNILFASILGQTVSSNPAEIDNPLKTIDKILNVLSNQQLAASIINFHGDFSSEKRVFGYYLDSRASAVIGDHWHVPTADAMVLPGGTAHITDVGMCGTLHSSLGVKTPVIAERWKFGKSSRNEIEQSGPLQFNAVLLDIDETTGLARSIEHIQRIIK
ncbi:YmdB family metallophosphoesterase [Candidatus Parcubacteria bacterium]|nr:YmdB family metallophosphoesterase [Candidatus Parcubacteria bacterium]